MIIFKCPTKKIFCHAKIFGQFPGLTISLEAGFGQLVLRDELFVCPFVCPVLIFLADIPGRIAVIKGAGLTVAHLMGQLDLLIGQSGHPPGVHGDGTGAVLQRKREGFRCPQVKPIDLCPMFLGQTVKIQQISHVSLSPPGASGRQRRQIAPHRPTWHPGPPGSDPSRHPRKRPGDFFWDSRCYFVSG